MGELSNRNETGKSEGEGIDDGTNMDTQTDAADATILAVPLSDSWMTVLGPCLCLLCLLGLTSNFIVSTALSRSQVRKSKKYLLRSMTFFDSALLVTYLVSFTVYFADPDHQNRRHARASAMFLHPVTQTVYTGSVYSIVAVTIERFIAARWTLHVNHLLPPKLVKRVIFGVFVLSVMVNSPRWFESMDVDVDHEKLHRNQHYVLYYHGVAWITIMYAVPLLILVTFNFLIWAEVRQSNIRRKELMGSFAFSIPITKILLLILGTFLACGTTNVVIICIRALSSGVYDAFEIGTLSATLLILCSSLNALVYCSESGSSRKELKKLVRVLAMAVRLRLGLPGPVRQCKKGEKSQEVRQQNGGAPTEPLPLLVPPGAPK